MKKQKTRHHRVDAYAYAVRDGTIIAGPLVRLACERHLRDRKAKRYRFNEAKADRVIAFFETILRLPDTTGEDGSPKPFILQPWQAFIVGSLIGWELNDRTRRFQDAYIEVGKGNGKTPLAAGLGLFGLTMDGELAAEVYAAAVTLEQARICWRDAEGMVKCSPALQKQLDLSVANIAHRQSRSYFRAISSEHRGLDGKRPHFGIIDEIHEHPDAQVVTKMRAGRKGRRQPLFIEITNAGFDKTTICGQHHEKSRKMLEGLIDDDRWFAYVASLDEKEDPLNDSSCWIKANPNLGVSIRRDYLETQVRTAKDIPSETNMVLRLNFCIWTRAVARYIPAGTWAACEGVLDDAELAAAECYGGIDLGETDDFSCWARAWRLSDGRIGVKVKTFVPEAAEQVKLDRPYRAWQQAGSLEITDGNQADFDRIEDVIRTDCQDGGILQVGYDKRFALQMAQHLMGDGIVMVDTPQGFYFNEALRWFSKLVQEQKIVHDGDPLLAWMIDNAVTIPGRERQIRLAKDKATEKMDGVSALIMALDRAMRDQPEEQAGFQVWGDDNGHTTADGR
uniref:Putative terminase n=1 Tax=viral metagenome TaxID=1070528 RepID=A0A6M3J7L9_9ZZZZ